MFPKLTMIQKRHWLALGTGRVWPYCKKCIATWFKRTTDGRATENVLETVFGKQQFPFALFHKRALKIYEIARKQFAIPLYCEVLIRSLSDQKKHFIQEERR